MNTQLLTSLLTLAATLFSACIVSGADDLGLFEGQGDVGKTGKAGSVAFDPTAQAYVWRAAARTSGAPMTISISSGSA